MSNDNKQLVKGMYDAFGRGDIATVLAGMTEDVSWHLPGAAPFSGRHHGRGEVERFFSELNRLVQLDQFDVDEVLGDGDRVVVLGRERMTVRETGQHVEFPWAHVYRVRNGKVSEAYLFDDTHAVASAFGESTKEKQALGGPLGVSHGVFSGGPEE